MAQLQSPRVATPQDKPRQATERAPDVRLEIAIGRLRASEGQQRRKIMIVGGRACRSLLPHPTSISQVATAPGEARLPSRAAKTSAISRDRRPLPSETGERRQARGESERRSRRAGRSCPRPRTGRCQDLIQAWLNGAAVDTEVRVRRVRYCLPSATLCGTSVGEASGRMIH